MIFQILFNRVEMEQTTTTVKETAIVQREIDTPPPYKPYRTILCCTLYKDRSNFQNILKFHLIFEKHFPNNPSPFPSLNAVNYLKV